MIAAYLKFYSNINKKYLYFYLEKKIINFKVQLV